MAKQPSAFPWATLAGIAVLCAGAYAAYDYLIRQASQPVQASTAATFGVAAGSPVATLPESERRHLWDVEHEAFVLSNVVFPEMAQALRSGDSAKLTERFDADLAARIPTALPALSGREVWEVRHWPESPGTGSGAAKDAAATTADRDRVLEQLDALRRFVDEPAGVQWALMQLSPDQRDDLSGGWTGTTLVRIWGRSSEGAPREMDLRATFRTRGKPDQGDGVVAAIVEWTVTSVRAAGAKHFLLRELAAERGIDVERLHDNWDYPDETPRLVTGGLYVCDYDDDDRLDVLVTDWTGARLYRGMASGRFVDATESAGLDAWDTAAPSPAVFADLDGDGRLDLILGDRMLRNAGEGRFEPVVGGRTPPADVAGYAVADFDRDGRVDLYMVRGSRGPGSTPRRLSWLNDASGPGNLLWRNLGGWQFEDVTAATNTAAGNRSCFSAVWLDADGDGWPDLFVGDEFGEPLLLSNRRGRRFEERAIGGTFGGFCMGVCAGDVDNDGRTDLYLANMYSKAGNRIFANLDPASYPPAISAKIREFTTGSELYLNRGKFKFDKSGRDAGVAAVGWAYGPSLIDLDGDGYLDIYAPAGFQSVAREQPDG